MDRKLGRLSAAFVLAFVVQTAAFGQSVTDEVDRFTGQRKLGYVGKTTGLGKPTVTIFAHIGGKTPLNGIRFMISPAPTGRYATQSMRFIGCRKVEWLIDGVPAEMGMVVHDFQRFDRLLVEFVTQEISTDRLAQIGNASTVEYRLCGVAEGTFTAIDIAAAKGMAETIREAGEATNPQKTPI